MKKLLTLCLLFPATSFAELSLPGNYQIGLPSQINVYAMGIRDLRDGIWKAGSEAQVLSFKKNHNEFAYASAGISWSVDGPNSGHNTILIGGGITAGTVAVYLKDFVEHAIPAFTQKADRPGLPNFLGQLGNWTTLEIGGGYTPNPISGSHLWTYYIGGRVKIPLNLLRGL